MSDHINGVLHTGISVLDMERSLDWYKEVLGFTKIKEEYIPPLRTRIVFIRRDDLDYELELFRYDEPNPVPSERLTPNSDLQTAGTKHVAFEVDDVQALKSEFEEKGVDIVQQHLAVMFIRDPDGTLIEFIQRPQFI